MVFEKPLFLWKISSQYSFSTSKNFSMNRFFQSLLIAVCLMASNFLFAQNNVTYVYEDNTGNNGKVEWTRTMEVHDAEIGLPKKVLMPVKNISTEPLRILQAKTHCGCTEATAPTEPIAPGETGYVEIIFTAKPRYENDNKMTLPPFTFYQIVDLMTNFDTKNSVVVSVQGTVIK